MFILCVLCEFWDLKIYNMYLYVCLIKYLYVKIKEIIKGEFDLWFLIIIKNYVKKCYFILLICVMEIVFRNFIMESKILLWVNV